jgi:serine O-acetyltransferase
VAKDVYNRLVYTRRWPLLGRIAYYLLKLLGIEIPLSVEIGEGFYLVHGGMGVVIHPKTRIGRNVKIYPGVTLGRADIHLPMEQSKFESILVGDDVILSPGAKILCKNGTLTVAAGSVIGANAVLLESTAPGEVWAGVPAKQVGRREGWSA